MKGAVPANRMRPQAMQSSMSRSLAPASRAMGSMSNAPPMEKTVPSPSATRIIMEKYRLASSGLPSPIVRATMALPPEPSIKPKADRIIATGKMMFTADNASSPTRLDTNRPSTTLQMEVKIMVTIEGAVKRNSFE